MENVNIILLVVSCAVSFALGRVYVHFRDKKRKKLKDEAAARYAQTLREQPAEPESKNKSKRKRQQQQNRADQQR
jgi:mannitol-specific phosphotransferase system IIBC component